MPEPCNSLKLIKVVGEGTFSTVYLVRRNITKMEMDNTNIIKHDPTWRRWYAVKHLIPTSSPERILTEVECLRISNGLKNVVPLLFCHRILGDVVLVMPYIENNKFNDVIRTMDHIEMKTYMKNLLQALCHIHSLGIIHRDIKPANFLYDRKRRRYGLVDFGLAQKVKHPPNNFLNMLSLKSLKNKHNLGTDDMMTGDSEPKTPSHSKRTPLEDCTHEENNINRLTSRPSNPSTPTSIDHYKPTPYYYDKRGCLLKEGSPGKKYINHRKRLKSEEICPLKEKVESIESLQQDQNISPTLNNVLTPPKKNKIVDLTRSPILRRSPRKHFSRLSTSIIESTGSKQLNGQLEPWHLPRRSPRKHSSSRETLKQISHLYNGRNNSLPSFPSKARSTDVATHGVRTTGGYSKLTISGSAIVPTGKRGLSQNIACSSHFESIPAYSTPNVSHLVNKRIAIKIKLRDTGLP